MTPWTSKILLCTLVQSLFYASAFELKKGRKDTSVSQQRLSMGTNPRRDFLECTGLALVVATFAPKSSNALTSYSANARNMERMNAGDYSGGSVYDNNPKSEAGKKRRAMVGCKNEASRFEASQQLNKSSLSEQDCNKLVLGGDTEFMLRSLRNLDCPTCSYGIRASPN